MVAVRRALSPAAALPALAAPFFILASFSGWERTSSNTELLANLFILAGVWFLVARDMGRRPLHLVVGGAFIGIACLYRYQSGAALLAYAATILLRHRQFDRKLARLLLLGAGFVLPGAVFVAYYAHIGALDDLRLLLAYQWHHTHDADDFYLPSALGQGLLVVSGLWPLLLLALSGRPSRSCGGAPRLRGARFSAPVCRHLGEHLLRRRPPLRSLLRPGDSSPRASGRGPPAARARHLEPGRTPRQAWFEAHALAIMVAAAIVFTAINGTSFWTRKAEPPRRDLVAFVEAHSRPSDQVLLWTWCPELLFQTNRVFATRQLVNGPLIGLQYRRRPWLRRSGVPGLWPIYLRDLAAAPPKLIFDAPPGRSDAPIDSFPQLASLLTGYHPCQIIDEVCVWLRKD